MHLPTLGFNNPWIQRPLDSMTLGFNYAWIQPGQWPSQASGGALASWQPDARSLVSWVGLRHWDLEARQLGEEGGKQMTWRGGGGGRSRPTRWPQGRATRPWDLDLPWLIRNLYETTTVVMLNICQYSWFTWHIAPSSYLYWCMCPFRIQRPLYSTTLGFNYAWIQWPVDSTTLGFNNPWIQRPLVGFNDLWIKKTLDSTILWYNKKITWAQ